MEKYVILGGAKLEGEVEISGAKNSAVALIVAALMVDGTCIIENVPPVSDTYVLIDIINQPAFTHLFHFDGSAFFSVAFICMKNCNFHY